MEDAGAALASVLAGGVASDVGTAAAAAPVRLEGPSVNGAAAVVFEVSGTGEPFSAARCDATSATTAMTSAA
ncbi:MAG TPA: hypothetical protein VF103_10375, partial [Polyangiaceae bacterium]